jgi:3'-phosphoadenosine 5'-phosphosulfate sulfotransferase (PAPS reductase)/FAD synthetase
VTVIDAPALFDLELPAEVTPDLDWYDIFLVNSSAGKDSQAMLSHLVRLSDETGVSRSKFVVVHADLGRVEWPGTLQLARAQAEKLGLRFEVVEREEDLLDHVLTRDKALRARPDDDGKAAAWPSSTTRWCTSDHKTSQVVKLITRLVDEIDPKRIGRPVRILNCLGIRAAESYARAKKVPFGPDPAGNGKRRIDRWLPIFHWSEDQVWKEIRRSGLPHHPAYDQGMKRLSCCFCVLASTDDLVTAARLMPELAATYADVERQIGKSFKNGQSMAEIIEAAGDWRVPAPVNPDPRDCGSIEVQPGVFESAAAKIGA